jgi:hypothetical protein
MLRRPVEFLEVIALPKVRDRLFHAFWCFAFATLISAVVIAQPQNARPPSLSFDDVGVLPASRVRFKVVTPDGTPPQNVAAQEKDSYETADHKFVLFLDPEKIASTRYSGFVFDTYVKRQGDVKWYVYNVLASPEGQFADLLENVNFKIKDASGDSVGTIRLPLHSNFYDDDLQCNYGLPCKKDQSPILQIKMSDIDGPAIDLQNTLKTLGIHVTKVVVRRECHACWQDNKAEPIDILIRPSSSASIPLNIRPKPLSAMLSTALMLKSESQEHLSITIDYNVDQGGVTKQKPFDVRVRFTPSLWQLTIAVLAGALVGGLLKYFLDEKTTRLSASFVGQTILMAGIVEFLAVIAATYESKLIILSFDLDPRQVIPAFLIAFAFTGGPHVTKWALAVIRPGSGNPQEPVADAAVGKGHP